MILKFIENKTVELFLENSGTKKIPHIKNSSLYDHFLRVRDILKDWDADQKVVLAGMCHSIYSTEFFHKSILDIKNRAKLQDLIGEESENLVFIFSSMIRSSLKKTENSSFFYTDRNTNQDIEISEEVFKSLVHIIIANEIDHLTFFNFEAINQKISSFCEYDYLLKEKTNIFLQKIKKPSLKDETKEFIRYIGHAGLQLKTKETSLTIDPWLNSSTLERPLIEGFHPSQKTIDFAIPKPVNTIQEIQPEILLLSHFHTHHAPFLEIQSFAKNNKIIIVCPFISDFDLAKIKIKITEEVFNNIEFKIIKEDTEIVFKDILIKIFSHTQKGHLGFFVKSKNLSFIHISDGKPNSKEGFTDLGEEWDKIKNTKPDYLFLSAAGHSYKEVRGVERVITENVTLTPVQAAKLTEKVLPKKVALIGVQNMSIWDSGVEHSYSLGELENQFYWAVSWLVPSIEIINLKPGNLLQGK
jgi:hypothetical protein